MKTITQVDMSTGFAVTRPMTDEEIALLPPVEPAPVPAVVDMAQARLALLQAGLYTTVQDAVAAMTGPAGEAARIEWEFRATVRRDSPLVQALAAQLGLTDQTLDQLFTLAATL